MKHEEEKLVPVKSESELRVGMLIVATACECGSSHRGLLMESVSVRRGLGEGEYAPCPHGAEGSAGTAWRLAPPPCWDVPVMCCCGCSRGFIFRVDTGLTDEASPYVTVTLPKRGVVSR
jgi:hypothetical protein